MRTLYQSKLGRSNTTSFPPSLSRNATCSPRRRSSTTMTKRSKNSKRECLRVFSTCACCLFSLVATIGCNVADVSMHGAGLVVCHVRVSWVLCRCGSRCTTSVIWRPKDACFRVGSKGRSHRLWFGIDGGNSFSAMMRLHTFAFIYRLRARKRVYRRAH